jgi:shikimate dehydrogenase
MRGLGLVGDERIAASPSPAIHDAIFGAGTYGLLKSNNTGDDANRVFAHAEQHLRGINITAPHKQRAAARYSSVLDDDAKRAGAVNTVVYGDDRQAIRAANTDIRGLQVAWHRASIVVDDRTIAIVGTGGAARAAVVAAADAGARGVIIHGRRRGAVDALVAHAASLGLTAGTSSAQPIALVVLAASDLDDPAATIAAALPLRAVVHELRYGPRSFASRNAALRAGHLFVDGTSMLLAQAEAAAALFAGRPLTDTEREAARAALVSALKRTPASLQ